MMSFDLSVSSLVKFMRTQFPPGVYDMIIDQMNKNVNAAILSNNFTSIDELYQSIAIG